MGGGAGGRDFFLKSRLHHLRKSHPPTWFSSATGTSPSFVRESYLLVLVRSDLLLLFLMSRCVEFTHDFMRFKCTARLFRPFPDCCMWYFVANVVGGPVRRRSRFVTSESSVYSFELAHKCL
jgi:hypothetical protein